MHTRNRNDESVRKRFKNFNIVTLQLLSANKSGSGWFSKRNAVYCNYSSFKKNPKLAHFQSQQDLGESSSEFKLLSWNSVMQFVDFFSVSLCN